MTTVITEFNLYKIKQEILNKFRWGFNSFDTQSRITETTTLFNGDNSETQFLLSATRMSYVKSVSVGGSPLDFGSAWDIEWRGADIGKVTFTSAPASGTDNISIVWGQINVGSQNFVHPDFPRTDLGTQSYPRVGFAINFRKAPGGLGGGQAVIANDGLIQIKVVGISTYDIDSITTNIENWIIQNSKNFYYFNYIRPEVIQNYDSYDDNTEEANYKILEFMIPRKLQVVTYT